MDIFKDIFSNLVIISFKPNKIFILIFNKFFDNDLTPDLVYKTLNIANNLTTAKLQNFEKEKIKSKTFSIYFSKKPKKKALKILISLYIAIKLIKSNK